MEEHGRSRLDVIEKTLGKLGERVRQLNNVSKSKSHDPIPRVTDPPSDAVNAENDRFVDGDKSERPSADLNEQRRALGDEQKRLRKEKTFLHALLRHLEQVSGPLESYFDTILAGGRPCDGSLHVIFGALNDAINVFNNKTTLTYELIDLSILQEALNAATTVAQSCRSNVKVVIDRAGGGKTNLLCHMALERCQSEPCLFLAGRMTLDYPGSVLKAIRKRLTVAWLPSDDGWIESLDKELSLARSHLTVLLDGINESRDLVLLNEALNLALASFSGTRVRFVITCRDIYWGFFADQPWRRMTTDVIFRGLYEFTDEEQVLAIDAYLRHFKIKVTFGQDAREKCRHPLLLRFFCEAYSRSDGEVARRGHVEEIRIKPLFDDYWQNKMDQLRAAMNDPTAPSPENCLFAVVAGCLTPVSRRLVLASFRALREYAT